MPTTQKIQTHKHIEFMKPFFILLGLSICVMSLSAQEAYQYNQFYYQRSTLFEKLPIDSDDIVFLGNSITNGCEWHELFNNPNIKNRGISSDVSMGGLRSSRPDYQRETGKNIPDDRYQRHRTSFINRQHR